MSNRSRTIFILSLSLLPMFISNTLSAYSGSESIEPTDNGSSPTPLIESNEVNTANTIPSAVSDSESSKANYFYADLPSEADVDASNNIANSILDTLSADIAGATLTSHGSRDQIEVNIRWNSNLETVEQRLENVFSFERSTTGIESEALRVMYELSEPPEYHDAHGIFKALVENKILLVVEAGKYKESITIATAIRNEYDGLDYVMLPSSHYNYPTLIIRDESLPIIFKDIPRDEARLIRDVRLSIVLERLDTGLTFSILLDRMSI